MCSFGGLVWFNNNSWAIEHVCLKLKNVCLYNKSEANLKSKISQKLT